MIPCVIWIYTNLIKTYLKQVRSEGNANVFYYITGIAIIKMLK